MQCDHWQCVIAYYLLVNNYCDVDSYTLDLELFFNLLMDEYFPIHICPKIPCTNKKVVGVSKIIQALNTQRKYLMTKVISLYRFILRFRNKKLIWKLKPTLFIHIPNRYDGFKIHAVVSCHHNSCDPDHPVHTVTVRVVLLSTWGFMTKSCFLHPQNTYKYCTIWRCSF